MCPCCSVRKKLRWNCQSLRLNRQTSCRLKPRNCRRKRRLRRLPHHHLLVQMRKRSREPARTPSASVATFLLFPCGWLASKQCEPIHIFQPVAGARSGLRPQRNLLNRINLIWAVQSCLQKHFRSSPKQITSLVAPSRPTRGAARDRHERGAGCDGRRWCF